MISDAFPLDIFTGLLARHLETFKALENLQAKALQGMGAQSVDGIAALMAGQQDVLMSIAREKAELKPYLDEWEKLAPEERGRLRQGKAGEILDALETVARGIQARHQDWFGEDPGTEKAKPAGEAGKPAAAEAQDISQKIKLYRGLT